MTDNLAVVRAGCYLRMSPQRNVVALMGRCFEPWRTWVRADSRKTNSCQALEMRKSVLTRTLVKLSLSCPRTETEWRGEMVYEAGLWLSARTMFALFGASELLSNPDLYNTRILDQISRRESWTHSTASWNDESVEN